MGIKAFCYLLVFAAISSLSSCACNRVEPQFEGVLSSNWGRNIKDYKIVQGKVGVLAVNGSEKLYKIPMYEQAGQLQQTVITSKDGQAFKIEPRYRYSAMKGHGPEIAFKYSHISAKDVGEDTDKATAEGDSFLDAVEERALEPQIYDAYREIAREYATDSLLNNVNAFEKRVEARLTEAFMASHFVLLSLSSNLEPPSSMIEKIEARNNVAQEIGKAQQELNLSRIALEKAKIDAQADIERSKGLTPEILQLEYYKAIKPTDKVITDGKTPVIISRN